MRGRLGLLAILALAPAGCITGTGKRPEPVAATLPMPTVTEFAEFPRAPGSRVPAAPVPTPSVTPVMTPPAAPPQSLSTAAFDSPLVAALRAEQDGRGDAADYLKRLAPPDRELTLRLLHAAVLAERAELNSPETIKKQELARELAHAQTYLAPYAPLEFRKAMFVERADGFSRYTPVPRGHHYSPGGVAELYVELHNARPTPVGPRSAEFEVKFRWRLSLRRDGRPVEVVGPGGYPVAELKGEYVVPRTRDQVRDCGFTLPVPVPPESGLYQVVVEVQDVNRPANAFVVSNRLALEVGPRPAGN